MVGGKKLPERPFKLSYRENGGKKTVKGVGQKNPWDKPKGEVG